MIEKIKNLKETFLSIMFCWIKNWSNMWSFNVPFKYLLQKRDKYIQEFKSFPKKLNASHSSERKCYNAIYLVALVWFWGDAFNNTLVWFVSCYKQVLFFYNKISSFKQKSSNIFYIKSQFICLILIVEVNEVSCFLKKREESLSSYSNIHYNLNFEIPTSESIYITTILSKVYFTILRNSDNGITYTIKNSFPNQFVSLVYFFILLGIFFPLINFVQFQFKFLIALKPTL